MSCVSLENVKVDQQKIKDWHGYSTADKITTVESKTFFSRGELLFFCKSNKTKQPRAKQPICGKGGLISDFIITINACQKSFVLILKKTQR